MSFDDSFGRTLKQRRKALDLTREELAERVGCAVETIRKLETGARRPSRQIAERLAEQLRIPPDERAAFVQAARAPRPQETGPEPAGAPVAQPPLMNLPIPATPLIGRAHEVAAVATALASGDIRLLTLTGPPGIGKTRISLQAATELVEDAACEVCFVALAPISLPSLVASTIAQALGVKETAGQSIVESLKHYLDPRQLLLLLDNFEQVVADAPIVAELLAACPRLKVLATSRVPLHLSGEHEYTVPPMEVPEPDMAAWPAVEGLEAYESVRLFVARARAVSRDFALTKTNARAVAEICWRLNGLPLAIELAAARIKVFDPRSLLEQVAGRTGRSSLDLLAGGARDLPARQQTVRGAIDWSFHLLDPAQQRLFARLSVFVGGFTLEAVAAVCGGPGDPRQEAPPEPSILDGITSLVDNSLLERSTPPVDDQDSEPRFRMLELIREYARERLAEHGDAESTSRRHALHYVHMVEQAEPELAKARQQLWLRRLLADYGNIRAALSRLIDWEEHDLAARLAAALWQFWEVRGMLSEGREWLENVLRHAGDLAPAVRAETLNAAGQLARHQGDVTRAATLFEENLLLRQQLGGRRGIAYALNDLAIVRLMQGDLGVGVLRLEEGLALFRAEQDTAGIADSLLNLSGARLFQGDREKATACLAESLKLFREIGNLRGIAAAQGGLGFLLLLGGDLEQATSLFGASLALNQQIGDRLLSLHGVIGLAATAARQARLARAARLFGGAEAWRQALGIPPFPAALFDVEAEMERLRDRMDEASWHRGWTAGAAMPPEHLVAYALSGHGDDE